MSRSTGSGPVKGLGGDVVDYLVLRRALGFKLDAPDTSTWTGRRDHALLVVGVQTGLRVSELIRLTRGDVHLGTGAHVRCHGKGRKDRHAPHHHHDPSALGVDHRTRSDNGRPALRHASGQTPQPRRDRHRLALHTTTASVGCPSLRTKKISAHVLRHTAAMRLLEAGVDTTVIALWLGHEQLDTTAIYLHADLSIKE